MEAEEKAFNAAVDGLTPDSDEEPIVPGEKPAPEPEPEPEYFLGEMTKEEVLEKLQKLDELENMIQDRVASRVFGKFGEVEDRIRKIQEQIEALSGKEFQFSPEALKNLRELDEGVAEALGKDLAEALKVSQFDKDSVLEQLQQSVNPYVEERILMALEPRAGEIVQSEEFAEWFWKEAPQEAREALQAWDNGQRDGVAVAQVFKAFREWQEKQVRKKEEKKKVVEKAEEGEKPRQKPSTRAPLSEEEAFMQRVKEVMK